MQSVTIHTPSITPEGFLDNVAAESKTMRHILKSIKAVIGHLAYVELGGEGTGRDFS